MIQGKKKNKTHGGLSEFFTRTVGDAYNRFDKNGRNINVTNYIIYFIII